MAWLDLLIIVLFVLSIAIGYKRGFIITLFSIGSYVVAFILSRMYYAELSQWIKETFSFSERINEFIAGYIELNLPDTVEGVATEGIDSNQMASLFSQESFKMPSFIQNYLINELEVQTFAQQTLDGIKNQIVDTLGTLFLNIISMIILFFLIRWTIVIIGMIINKIFELPILGAFNQVLGAVLGGIRGVFIIIITLFIFIPISMSRPDGLISISIEESYLVQFFLNYVVIYFIRGLGAIF